MVFFCIWHVIQKINQMQIFFYHFLFTVNVPTMAADIRIFLKVLPTGFLLLGLTFHTSNHNCKLKTWRDLHQWQELWQSS